MSLPRDIALEYARTLRTHFYDKLMEWEQTFVVDMKVKLESDFGFIPSDKQSSVLDRIMERCADTHR